MPTLRPHDSCFPTIQPALVTYSWVFIQNSLSIIIKQNDSKYINSSNSCQDVFCTYYHSLFQVYKCSRWRLKCWRHISLWNVTYKCDHQFIDKNTHSCMPSPPLQLQAWQKNPCVLYLLPSFHKYLFNVYMLSLSDIMLNTGETVVNKT